MWTLEAQQKKPQMLLKISTYLQTELTTINIQSMVISDI